MMGRALPFAEWPDEDQRLWEGLTRQGGPFDDRGALAHLREPSRGIIRDSYGRWLFWLADNDPATLREPPAARATPDRLKAWLNADAGVSPTSRKMYFGGALRVLREAFPKADWTGHLRVERQLARLAGRGDPARKQGRILSSRVLLDAGLRHAGPEADAAPTPLGRAKAQRDGAMVALLAMMPALRHRALTGLTIGQSLLVTDRALTVVLSDDLTKCNGAWEAEVPDPAATVLRRYLGEARPFLLSRGGRVHDALWVSNRGDPMGYSYIGKKVPEVTGRLTGVRVPPHFFRDAAATTLARESPQAALVIAPVLGHDVARTSEQHYIQAGSVEVGRDHAKLLKRLREKS